MREVKIKQQFFDSVLEIRDFIAQESPKSGDKFIGDLKSKMSRIIEYPESFSPEQNLLTQRRIYRFALYKKRYKIIFKVLQNRLVFIDMVHGGRHPDYFKGLKTTDYQ